MAHIDEKIISILDSQQRESKRKEQWDERLEAVIKEIENGMVIESGIETEKRHFFDNRLSIYMPKYAQRMSDEHLKIKYPNENRPQFLFTNDTDSMNIGISFIKEDVEKFEAEMTEDIRDIMLESFQSVSPSSKILDSGTIKFDEGEETEMLIAYGSFDSFAIGGVMYNLIYVTIVDDAAIVVSLNCTMKNMEEFELLFYGIMHTTKVQSR